MKRYIALFTCMASRAVHLEVARSLEADSFLNAFRRFISRRGPVRQLRCDQGTNFLGAKKELREALLAMDNGKIKSELLKENCDWFEYKTNVPSASHAGGVWERQINTLRSVLSALIERNGNRLNDESFQTFICEAEAIVNCRPHRRQPGRSNFAVPLIANASPDHENQASVASARHISKRRCVPAQALADGAAPDK